MSSRISKSLDLHGVRHGDVFRVVDQFIGHHIMNNTNEVEVITGYSERMKELVRETLIDYGLTAKEAFMNEGKLIIKLG